MWRCSKPQLPPPGFGAEIFRQKWTEAHVTCDSKPSFLLSNILKTIEVYQIESQYVTILQAQWVIVFPCFPLFSFQPQLLTRKRSLENTAGWPVSPGARCAAPWRSSWARPRKRAPPRATFLRGVFLMVLVGVLTSGIAMKHLVLTNLVVFCGKYVLVVCELITSSG